ncbi:YegS/Rv2252/BmrU family lipid kinase [Clostridium polynesiense]|uniref:YegS/Rv2252/BmrU family lipid kinase n=1 Tax=Clostridium polynesiense TaxID=1325933 RepID=UPI00058E2FCE|nr:YegS/Rv2252/BmrU family lipid kinase [Clostridium polynesiense]
MKKVKFIYNPFSGENLIINEIDKVIKIHQKEGYTIIPFRIDSDSDIHDAFNDIDSSFSYILIAGGDGTIDSVVNIMIEKNIDLPIGVIPVGTANDFAKLIGMTQDISDSCQKIIKSVPLPVDIGKINNKYFVNVASTGLFTDVSQKTDDNLKNTIGKLAYYLKGLEQLPNFRKLKVNITSKEMNYDGYMYLLLIFNGMTAGNFKLAPKSHITDGLLDVIIFKAVPIKELLPLFIRVIKGEHLDDPGVVHFKTNELLVHSTENIVTDIDGEKGPDFPLSIKCIHNGIKVLGIAEK